MRSVVRVHLSPLISLKIIEYGGLAQLGERLPCKQEVTSSNLVFSTQIMKRADGVGRQDSEPGLPERRRLYDNRRIFEEYP